MNQNRPDERTTRIVTLDFNGGSHVYRNPELGMNIPVRIAPSGISAERARFLAEALNRNCADSYVRFEVGATSSENPSAVRIGRTSDFDKYGAFLGLAEGIGEGNAFVLLDDSANDTELVDVIRHEAGHILGTLDHGGAGLARYALPLPDIVNTIYDHLNSGEDGYVYGSYLKIIRTRIWYYYKYETATSGEGKTVLVTEHPVYSTEVTYEYSDNKDFQVVGADSDGIYRTTSGPINTNTVSSTASGISVAGITVDGGSASGCTCSSFLNVTAAQYYDTTSSVVPRDSHSATTKEESHSNVRRTEGSASGCVANSGSVTAGSISSCDFGAGGLSVSGVFHYVSDYRWEGVGTVPPHPDLSYVTYGRADNCTIRDGGDLRVGYGGTANSITVTSGDAIIGCRTNIASLPVNTADTIYSGGRNDEEEDFAEVGSVSGKASNLIVGDGNVAVNYGGELHNATINGSLSVTEGGKAEGVITVAGGLTARAGSVLNGAITCSGVDLSGVTPQATITIKVDLHDHVVANFYETLEDGTLVQYYANYTTKTTRYDEKHNVISVTNGTFDNKDGRFDMKDWKYTFSVNLGSVDELSVGSVVIDFGGSEKDFDEGEIGFFFPKNEDIIPFQLMSDKRRYTITYAYFQGENDSIIERPSGLLYNSALFGDAADVLWLEYGLNENVEYTIDLAPMMSGATEELTITDADTGKETLFDAKIQGAMLVVKGGAETADLIVKAEDSGRREHECDLELIVVPEEIPIIGKEGTKKYAAMLKKAQKNHITTTISDVLPYNIHTKFFGMAFDLTNMGISLTVNWTAPSMTVKLQGKMEWALGKGTAGTGKQLKLVVDLSGENYISITSAGGIYSWDIVGELKIPDFKLGKFEFSNMSLKIDKENAAFSASAYVKLPWIKYSFGGSIGIVDGYLDSMAIGVDNLNVPLGTSGLFLQKIEGGISGIATELNLSFNGTLGLTAGPKISVDFVDWLGIDSGEYSLCEMTLTGSISTSGDLEGSSSCVILGGLATGGGSAGIKGGELFVKGNYTFLNGCISIKGELHAGKGGITVTGTGTAAIPREKVFGPLAGVGMSANVSAAINQSASDSYVMAWQQVELFGNTFTIGFKSTFDGQVSLLGSTDLLKEGDRSNLRMLKSSSAESFSVAAGRRGTSEPSASRTITVSYSGTSLFQFNLTERGANVSLTFDGMEYTQAEIAAGLYENMQVVNELTGDKCITIAVDNAQSGEWTMNAYGDADASFGVYTVEGGVQKPVITTITVGETARSATIAYTLGDLSGLTDVQLSIYRTEKDAGYEGQRLAVIEAPAAEGSWEWVMENELAGGDYSFFLMVESEEQTPARSDISSAYAFRTLDTEAPDQIQIINCEWKSSGTVVSWEQPWDDLGVAGYKIRYAVGDGETAEIDVKTNSFTFDSGPNGTYDFRIAAYDEAGNLSAWSEEQSYLVLTVANAKYRDATLTAALELAGFESAVNITAGDFAVTAAANSLISGSVLTDAGIAGIVDGTIFNGAVTLYDGAQGYGLTVNGELNVGGAQPVPETDITRTVRPDDGGEDGSESGAQDESAVIVKGAFADSITVKDGGKLTVEADAKVRNVTVETGGSLALKDDAEVDRVSLAYGTTLIVVGGNSGTYRLGGDIYTAGTLSAYRVISGGGHKIHFEQYRQTAELLYQDTDHAWDNVALLPDMDKIAGKAVDVVIDSKVYGSFKIADEAEYFNGTITVTDSVDGSSAEVGFDQLMLVGNALCRLSKSNDGTLWLQTVRSEIGTPTVTVEKADSNAYDTINLSTTSAENSGYVRLYTYRYSLNADMSDAVTVDSTSYLGSVSLSKYDLIDNATYYVQVSVENENGVKSLWSDAVSFTVVPKLLPDAPATLTVTGATDKNSNTITFTATGVDDSNYTVREYRFRYADNPEMTNAVVITTGQRLINDAYINKSDIEDGKDYYVQAGVKQLNDWSYWSDIVVFNTQGWDYENITIGPEPDGDFNYFSLNGKRAKNVTVIDGGCFYGGGDVDGLTLEAGSFFRDDGAAVTNAVVNGGEYWLSSGSVSDIMVNGGEFVLRNGTLNGATIGVDATMDLSSSYMPTITGTILIQGTMKVYYYHPGVATGASFVFDLGAHEADKNRMFIDYTSPLLGTRTFTVKLDDTPEEGDYRLTYTPNSDEFYLRLAANDGTDLGLMGIGMDAIAYNSLYYSLVDQKGVTYLHVSGNQDPVFIGAVKLSKGGVIYDSDSGYIDLSVSATDECDHVLVEEGGQVYSVTIGRGGSVDVYGTVFGATIGNGGKLTLKEGCCALSNEIIVEHGGNVTVEGGKVELGAAFHLAGGTLTVNGVLQGWEEDSAEWGATRHWFVYELDKLTVAPSGVMVSDYAMLLCNPEFTANVSSKQAKGEYKLLGNAAGFTGYVSISCDGDNDWPEYLYVGNECTINGTKYALAVKNDVLTLTVGASSGGGTGGGTEQEKPAMPDLGENDVPVLPDGSLNPDAVLPINPLTVDGNTDIIMDAPESVSQDGYNNFVGGEDKIDCAQIILDKATKLSFTVEADSKVKLTFYQLVENKKKPGTYTRKSLKTVSISKTSGGEKSTASVLVESGSDKLYYVAVENKNKKNQGAYYNVSLTTEGKNACEFFSDGDNGDNNFLWNKTDKWNEKVHGEEVDALVIDKNFLAADNSAIQIDTDTETVVEHDGFTNYVGFGDAMDVRKIELKSAAKLGFDLAKTTGGAAKLIVYTVNDSGKMVVASSKLTVTTKAAIPSGSVKNPVVLQKGVYYISVQSTNAKKGKEAYYNVSLNANSVFYEDGDSGMNDFDSKTKTVKDAVKDNAVTLTAGEKLQLDGMLGGDDVAIDDHGVYTNFVGTGDVSDVVRINAVAGTKLSLKVTATDAVSLVVYGLQKNGTLKALKTVKSKNNVAELVNFELKAKSAPGGQFFLGVNSTNAKKGSEAYYYMDVVSVSGQESSSLAMPETDSLGISDALSFGGYDTDAFADASAASGLAELDGKSSWQNLGLLA